MFLSVQGVEGLYCKRPIQCLASSEILTPHPLTARQVCTPPLWCGGRTHSLGGGGGGGSIVRKTLDTACSVLYICKNFVVQGDGVWDGKVRKL
jgi:hypothetical protein